jgi:glycosyltransferase involved in cell wall biosynthesis
MRILMLAQFYPPAIGGEERLVADLSADLAERGHDVAVVTLWHEGFPEFEVARGVRIYRVRGTMQRIGMLFSESDRQYAPPFPDPEVLLALRRIIRKEQPDIVHAHNWIVHSFTPLKSWSKAKFVATLHDYSLACVQKRMMRQGVRCAGPGLAKCLACATDFYGIAKGPLTVLANSCWEGKERQAVDMFLPISRAVAEGTQLDKHNAPYRIIPDFIPNEVAMAGDDENPLLERLPKGEFLLFVGDIRQDKGVDVLLRAYAGLETQVPLVLIGRPVEDFAGRLPPNVLLLGGWPHEVVMSAWSRCMIGLVPSTWAEPFGIVALEAMYMGKPVIAALSGGLSDVVADGETGLLVPPGDAGALRNAIQCLLADPARRERMGAQAKQRVLQFQAKAVVSRLEQVYNALLGMDSSVGRSLAEQESR